MSGEILMEFARTFSFFFSGSSQVHFLESAVLSVEVCPYTVTDDRVGRHKKRKDNGKEFFPTRLW
jgi:hypothetical protein